MSCDAMIAEPQQATSTVHNVDCLDFMRSLPDNAFDLAIVDPPYGVGSITYMPHTRTNTAGGYIDRYNVTVATLSMEQRGKVKVNVERNDNGKTIRGFGDENVSPPPEYFAELFRVSRHQIIWGGNYFLLPPTRGFIVWNKCQGENFSMAMCEYAWTSFNKNAKLFACPPMGTAKDPRIHPTQKPVKLYSFILKHFAQEGWSILDTHVGSGSSRIACFDAGYDFTGCEISRDYWQAQEARFLAHVVGNTNPKDAQGGLF